MRKGHSMGICIAVSLMLTNIGFAQDRNQDPRARERGNDRGAQDNRRQQTNRDPGARQRGDDAGGRLGIYLRRRMENLLPQLGESVGRHCGLDETTVDSLRATIFESVNTMLRQGDTRGWGLATLRIDGFTLLETMLSRPAESLANRPPSVSQA